MRDRTELGKDEKDRLEEGNCKFIDYLQVDYLQCLLITDVSSDLFRKEEIDLLSLMSFGTKVLRQSFAPSYIKLFFIV